MLAMFQLALKRIKLLRSFVFRMQINNTNFFKVHFTSFDFLSKKIFFIAEFYSFFKKKSYMIHRDHNYRVNKLTDINFLFLFHLRTNIYFFLIYFSQFLFEKLTFKFLFKGIFSIQWGYNCFAHL